jgi:hypothetical protein
MTDSGAPHKRARHSEVRQEQPILERESAQRAAEYAATVRLLHRQHELRLVQIALEAEQIEVERQAAIRKS